MRRKAAQEAEETNLTLGNQHIDGKTEKPHAVLQCYFITTGPGYGDGFQKILKDRCKHN